MAFNTFFVAIGAALLLLVSRAEAQAQPKQAVEKIPVLIDTDIDWLKTSNGSSSVSVPAWDSAATTCSRISSGV